MATSKFHFDNWKADNDISQSEQLDTVHVLDTVLFHRMPFPFETGT